MPKRGKKYKEALQNYDKLNLYEVDEAMKVVVDNAKANFDETVEVHCKLGVDGRHADQQVRGAIVLPNGTGKTARVLVFAKGDRAEEAKAAGAEYVGEADLVEKIQKENWFEFDVVIAANIIHTSIGKVSFGPEKLQENFNALLDAIVKAKPAAAKGQYLKSVTVASSMGPGVKVNPMKIGG